ncbi:ABC transporter ATP-binding protein [Micromonospora fluostatini]|uniref:ABC transporter ATP-binding protein n=1 Tax=Micromonospora sp. JCM 30529 TaxID=3421643 RepID=UPI003D183670
MRQTLASCRDLLGIAWRQHRGRTVTAVLLMLGGAVAAPLGALALRGGTDAVVAGRTGTAALAGLLVAVCAIAALTFGHFAHIAYYELSELSVLDLDRQLIELANGTGGTGHHERPEFVDALTVVRQDVQRFTTALQSLLSLAGLALAMGLTTVLLARLDPWLLLLLPLAVPPLLAGRRAEEVLDRAKLATAERSRVAMGLFRLTADPAPGKELRVFRLRDEVLRRHRTIWAEVTGRLWRAHLHGTALRAGGQVLFAVGYLGGLLLVVREAAAGRRTVGDVTLAIALAAQVSLQVATAVTLLTDLHRMSGTLRRLGELRRSADPADGPPPDRPVPDRLTRGVELVGVSFRYPGADRPSLREVDLTLPAGATVAVIGENGAGKTSLVKLLCGFHQPDRGRILVDGTDLRRIPPGRWQRRIAAGFQDFVRFEFTVRESVGVGDLPRIDSAPGVLAALDRAGAADLPDRLVAGLETRLGGGHPDGTDLSGGQWQKLALGRAFMREQPLLQILDEPTAALDPQAEHALFERYAEQARRSAGRGGAITLLISHRFSTARMADLIVVLADGGVVEVGDHDTLVARDGLYAELYRLQAAAYS